LAARRNLSCGEKMSKRCRIGLKALANGPGENNRLRGGTTEQGGTMEGTSKAVSVKVDWAKRSNNSYHRSSKEGGGEVACP